MKKNGDEILLMWVEKMLFPDVRKTPWLVVKTIRHIF